MTEADLKDSSGTPIDAQVFWLLTKVSHFLAEQGIQSYVVGGWVRDVLLGRDTADIDLAVAGDARDIAAKVAAALGGKYVLLDEVNRVSRVVLTDQEATATKRQRRLDFATIDGDIEQDLARRDFTIDAMALELRQIVEFFSASSRLTPKKRGRVPLRPAGLIDPFNGWQDLHRGVIRAVSPATFAADAVRLLRAIRLAAELGFTIDKQTEALLRRDSHLIAEVAGERVREELLRLLAVPGAGQWLAYLDELGLLLSIFPELAQMKGVDQSPEHFWDVFRHSLQTVVAVDFLLRQGDWEYTDGEVLTAVPWSAALAQYFAEEVSGGSTRQVLLKVAALLHDIAKPQTKIIEAGGRTRFLGHAKEGADIVPGILARLRFSAKEVKLVAIMVRHHLRPTQMSRNEPPTRRAIYRYFRDTAGGSIDTLFLSLADHLATRGPHLDWANWREHTQIVADALAQHFQEETRPLKLVDGHDIINIFGISPGPKIGEILEAVREAQASKEIASRQEALTFIERLLTL